MKKILMLSLLGFGVLTQSVQATNPEEVQCPADATPEIVTEVLNDANMDFGDKHAIYDEYLKRDEVDPEIVERILFDDNIDVYDEDRELDINDIFHTFVAYLKRQNIDAGFAERLLIRARELELCKSYVYSAYIRHMNANLEIVEELIDELKNSVGFCDAFVAYIGRTDAYREQIQELVTRVLEANSHGDKVQVYVAYIGRDDADPELVESLADAVQGADFEDEKSRNYLNYIERSEIDLEVMTKMMADVHEFTNEGSKYTLY